ncbi:MAG: ABC transporter permease, partial [Desulfovibrio sp.]|nr:ABC transporter permease [Desulfovibrio sp.]
MTGHQARGFRAGPPRRAAVKACAVLALCAMMLLLSAPGRAASRGAGKGHASDMPRRAVMETMPVAAGEDFDRVIISAMAALGDRRAGTPGGEAMADFLFDFFSSLGLGEAGRQAYHLPFLGHGPVDIRVAGREQAASAHPTDLNALTPGAVPSQGMTGRVVYGGRGTFGDLSGREIGGRIVIMEL